MMSLDTVNLTLIVMKLLIISYAVSKIHVISNLLLLEFMVMSFLLLAAKLATIFTMELYLMFFMLILVITESILGLAVLISMIRTHSNDYMKSSVISVF